MIEERIEIPNVDIISSIPCYVSWELHDPEIEDSAVVVNVDYTIKAKTDSMALYFDRKKFLSMIKQMAEKSVLERPNLLKKIAKDRDNERVRLFLSLNKARDQEAWNRATEGKIIKNELLGEACKPSFEKICFLETIMRILKQDKAFQSKKIQALLLSE